MFKKKYGQNFLTSAEYSEKIVNSINIFKKNILEVGTGNMALTKFIIKKKPKKFISLEIDNFLFQKITKNDVELELIIKNIDAKKFDELSFFNDNFSIISNLPFNISSQLILKWTELHCFKKCINEMVLMFQKELGERIISKINSKKFGKISVLIQSMFKIDKLYNIEKNFFYPAPKVDTIVLKFTPLKRIKITPEKFENLKKITTFFFNSRRKKNIKKIKRIFPEKIITKYKLNNFFNSRAENISVDQYCEMANLI